jgi:hypothetical protein
MIYDPVRDRLLVFGGASSTSYYFPEVSALSLSGTPTWTTLATSGTAPPGRSYHVAIYDPVRDRMLVYGGYNGYPLTDLWALSLAGTPKWSKLQPVGAPSPPSNQPTAVYDPVGDRMLVYGGFDFALGSEQSRLIALSLATNPPSWAELHPGGVSVPARYAHSAVYDPDGPRMEWTGG